MAEHVRELVLTNRPGSWRTWFADLYAHRDVLAILARKDFQTRYKRASLGVVWAVAVPVLQGAVMAVVFSRVIRLGTGAGFAAYVMSGIAGWAYFTGTLNAGATAVVDGANLSEKVWFPRLLLVLVPALSGLVGLVVSMLVLLALSPIIHLTVGWNLLLLFPACLMLIGFSVALSLVLSALHVYFRDVKFIVQAALLVWLYLTPVAYPKRLLGGLADVVDLNPMTGVVTVFHEAVGQGNDPAAAAIIVSLSVTVVLAVIGLVAHHHHDRLFVDRL